MTSRHGNRFPITGPLWWEFINDQNEELWCFLRLFTVILQVNPLPQVVPSRTVYWHRVKYHHCATLKTWVVMKWTFSSLVGMEVVFQMVCSLGGFYLTLCLLIFAFLKKLEDLVYETTIAHSAKLVVIVKSQRKPVAPWWLPSPHALQTIRLVYVWKLYPNRSCLLINKYCWFTTYFGLVHNWWFGRTICLEIVVCFWTFLCVNQCPPPLWGISILFLSISIKIWPTKPTNYKKDLGSLLLLPNRNEYMLKQIYKLYFCIIREIMFSYSDHYRGISHNDNHSS